MGRKCRRFLLIFFMVLFVLGCLTVSGHAVDEKNLKVGPVKMNLHPATLERRTVLLRWNGKYNGDKLLSILAELLIKQVKDVKIIKMWEVDPSTAIISKKMQVSEECATKMAKFKPDLVLAAQAD